MKKTYKNLIKKPTQDEAISYQMTLLKISNMGSGLKENVIDWQNIGKNAVHTAKEALRKKCKEYGK